MEASKQLSDWLYKRSSGWIALVSMIIFLLFIALVLPAQAKDANEISQETGSPDMSFIYTPGKLYQMAESYGVQGRAAYIRARFTFDLIWPLVYMLFLTVAISWSNKHTSISESHLWWSNLAPLIGMTFDYAENITTSLVMYRYPKPTNILAILAPILTATKWILIAGSFAILSAGIIAVIWQSFKKRSSTKLM